MQSARIGLGGSSGRETPATPAYRRHQPLRALSPIHPSILSSCPNSLPFGVDWLCHLPSAIAAPPAPYLRVRWAAAAPSSPKPRLISPPARPFSAILANSRHIPGFAVSFPSPPTCLLPSRSAAVSAAATSEMPKAPVHPGIVRQHPVAAPETGALQFLGAWNYLRSLESTAEPRHRRR